MLIWILAILIIAGGLVFYLNQDKQNQDSCTEEAKICADGTTVVRTGKYCEFEPCPDVEENRIYCKPEERNSEICTFLYEPVCGYPEKSTYPNSCVACSDEKISYWVGNICN